MSRCQLQHELHLSAVMHTLGLQCVVQGRLVVALMMLHHDLQVLSTSLYEVTHQSVNSDTNNTASTGSSQ
jgi:NADH:ubiquinone oxidoreductase subunit K